MKKTFFVIVGIIIVIIGFIIIGSKMVKAPEVSNTQNKTEVTNNTSTTTVSVTQPASQNTVNTVSSINIQNFAFNPSPASVKIGTKVTWLNQDPMPHQIKSPDFNSPVLQQGSEYSFTFTKAGTYNYSCAIHPSMKGVVIVQ